MKAALLPRPVLVLLIALLALCAFSTSTPATAREGDVIPGQYIVVFKPIVEDPDSLARSMAQEHATTPTYIYRHAVKGFAASLSDRAVQRLQSDSRVQFVSPDRVVTMEAQTLPTGVDRIDAELNVTARIDGSDERVNVDVAVIDTGIQSTHPDLHVVGGKNCSTGRSYEDGHGHCTHVAGTIGALDNGDGVVGVAPGARLWAVRVLNNAGSGTTSSVVCGIDWVTANASTIEVANMSLGGSGSDDGNCGKTNNDIEHQAICRSAAAGMTYAVAAGNSTDDAKNHIPAAYDEVITVSALSDSDGKPGGLGGVPSCRTSEKDDYFASFSNFGDDVDIAAPGVCILSTWKGSGYRTISGTSMATPHVAGAAALYKAKNASATPVEVCDALILNQEPGPIQGDPDTYKEGVLNAKNL